MEIYGTIHFKLILPYFPGFQQEPLPAPVCSHSPDRKDCPYLDSNYKCSERAPKPVRQNRHHFSG